MKLVNKAGPIAGTALLIMILSACNNGNTSTNSGNAVNEESVVQIAKGLNSGVQQSLYQSMQIGTALGPHLDDYENYNSNALNSVYQSFVSNDIKQLSHYGFKTVRLYGDPAETYISAIKNLPSDMKLVYQFSLCQSNATVPGADSPCYDVSGMTLGEIEANETIKLKQVIDAVGADAFKSKVAMVIVGNEDLTEPPHSNGQGPFNDADIASAMQHVASQLTDLGVTVATRITPAPDGVMLSTSNVIFNAHYVTNAQMKALLNLWTAGTSSSTKFSGPMVFDLYPYQFAGSAGLRITSPSSNGAVNGNYVDSLSGMINGISLRSNCLLNKSLTVEECNQLESAVTGSGVMIGETGWANGYNGSIPIKPSNGEYMGDFPGNTQAAEAYLNNTLLYIAKNKIPTLLFEAYDQMNKNGSNKSDPENHYGIMSWNNIPWMSIDQAGIRIGAHDTTYQFFPENVLMIYPNTSQSNGMNINISSYQVNGGAAQSFDPYHTNSDQAIGVMLNSGVNKFNFTRSCNGHDSEVSLCAFDITPSKLATKGASYANQSPLPAKAYPDCITDQYNGVWYSNSGAGVQKGYISAIHLGAAAGWADCYIP